HGAIVRPDPRLAGPLHSHRLAMRRTDRFLPGLIGLIGLAFTTTGSAADTAMSAALRDAAQREQTAVVDTLKDLVHIESGSGTVASQPWHQDGNKRYGPGIADDKGGIAVVLHALGLLQAAGWKDYAQLTVLFNPDEEIGSIGSGEAIAALADEHDVVLSCE